MNDAEHGGWLAWFARNPVAANLLMIFLLVAGGATALMIRTEGFPGSAPREIVIGVPFQGASPEDVEEGASVKVEEALNGVAGVKEITSAVSADTAEVIVRSKDGYPLDKLKDDVKIRIDAISSFPAQVERITIAEEQDENHVIHVQLSGDTDHATLKEVARRVRTRLLALPGVDKVLTRGARMDEINVELREEQLRAYDLRFSEVAGAIEAASLNLSAGTLKTEGGGITLQSRKQRHHGKELEGIVVRNSARGGRVLLRDIACVSDGHGEQQVLSRFQGKPSINLDVQLIGKASITRASQRVQEEVERIREEKWVPGGVELATWSDEADIIRGRLRLFFKNALTGMALVLVILALFLNIKIAFWVALGIPVSFAGALAVMGPAFLDYSVNDLTTFAFIIVLGIVVDDAIVIGENIFAHKKRNGGGVETAIHGAKEVAVPATFGVLTTVAAFYPLTIMTGDFGGEFRMIAVVTIIILLFSLVESKWILPAHLAGITVRNSGRTPGRIERVWMGLQEWLDHGLQAGIRQFYQPLLRLAIRHRYQALCVFLSILLLAGGLMVSGVVRSVFFGDFESDMVYVDLVMLPGTPAAQTHAVVGRLETGLMNTSRAFQHQYAMDESPVRYSYALSESDESAQFMVQLVPGGERSFSGREFLNDWREAVGPQPGARHLQYHAGSEDTEDLGVEMRSLDPQLLRPAMLELRKAIGAYKGVHDVKTNLDNQALELALELKPEAEALGVSHRDVINQLRAAVYGVEAQRIQRGEEEVLIKVRRPESERDQITDLERIRIRTPAGGTVPLFTLASLSRDWKQVEIERVDGKRVMELTARIDKSECSPSEIVDDLEDNVFPDIQARFPGVSFDRSGEAEEEQRAVKKLFAGFVLGLLAIYALLAIPLKSYTEPFVIMLAIPFGIIGAIAGHLVVGIPVSLLSFFGVLALSGVVVNDALVLVSRYNRIRQTGLPYEEAVVRAGMSRFRVVLLTSITTFCGLIPIIRETSEQAQILIPMAVSLAFGVLFATFITLLIIPVFLGIRLDLMEASGLR